MNCTFAGWSLATVTEDVLVVRRKDQTSSTRTLTSMLSIANSTVSARSEPMETEIKSLSNHRLRTILLFVLL